MDATVSTQIKDMDTKLVSMETKLYPALVKNKEMRAEIKEKNQVSEVLRTSYTWKAGAMT
jgi:hypothetical protein